ncbi:sulfur carrier protein ThiS [Streptomyces sp. NPDC049881]|uniref:sulfur carrier protein ThiS n=1 Tax=unclassified Streptomyces TaxID=2593676 RepID=UPI0034370405
MTGREATGGITLWVNGEARAYAPGTTLAAVVGELSRAPSGIAAAVNEAVVPRGRWPVTALADGDRIEVLTAVQGG